MRGAGHLFSSMLLFLADLIHWSNISHNALCHIVNQCDLHAPEDRQRGEMIISYQRGYLFCP